MEQRSCQLASKSALDPICPMMRYLLFVCCLAAFAAQGQDTLTVAQVLERTKNHPEVLAQNKIAALWRSANPTLPLLDEVSLRTQTRRSDIYQQDYQVRVAANGLRERRAYRQVQREEANIAEAKGREIAYDALYDAYLLLLDHHAYEQRQALLQNLLNVHLDRIRLFENAALSGGKTDPGSLMKAEFDRDGVLAEIEALSMKMNIAPRLLADAGTKPPQLDCRNWLEYPDMAARLLESLDTTSASHPKTLENQARMAKIDAEVALERARSQQVLDFVQMRYTNRPGEPFRNDFSVGAGFNIPWNGTRNARMQLLEIERFAEQEALVATQAGDRPEQMEAVETFLAHAASIKALNEQAAVFGKRYNLPELARTDQKGVEAVLLEQEFQVRYQLKALDHLKDLTEAYVRCIYLSGRLGERVWVIR